MLSFVLLVLGLAGLWAGAELVIKGALSIAGRFKISEWFVGLTLVAVGTDLPELFVSLSGAIDRLGGEETSGLVVGHILGSSMGQMALVLGILSFFAVFRITKEHLRRDGLFLLGAIVLLFLLGFDQELSRLDGFVLLGFYTMYILLLAARERVQEKVFNPKQQTLWAVSSLAGGLALLLFSSDLTVESALELSRRFAIAPEYVGVLIVGLGTSLPELVTSLASVRKGAAGLAAGNIFGSTILDLSLALGAATVISGFAFHENFLRLDLPFLFATAVFILVFFRTEQKLRLREASILVLLYAMYFGYEFWKGVL